MKNILLIILTVLFGIIKSQNGIYMEGETKMEGLPALFTKSMDVKIKSYYKKDKSLIELNTTGGVMKTLTIGENVQFTSGRDCYSDTQSEINKLQQEDVIFENVVVKLEPETKTILNYVCKKAVISYKSKVNSYTSDYETVVWYTDKINVDGVNKLAGIDGAQQANEYVKAMQSLNGFVLSTEQSVKLNNMKTTYTVTKLEVKDLDDELFKLNTKKCSKMRTYKEHKNEMKKKDATYNNMIKSMR